MSIKGIGLTTAAKLTAALQSDEFTPTQKKEISETLDWWVKVTETDPPVAWQQFTVAERCHHAEWALICCDSGYWQLNPDGELVRTEKPLPSSAPDPSVTHFNGVRDLDLMRGATRTSTVPVADESGNVYFL